MVSDNPLYPETNSFDDRWGGLPVDAPRFNYTPNSSLIESEPRKAEPFKLVPIQGDPFERSVERLRAPYKHVNDVPEGKIPYRSNLPLIVDKFMNTAVSGATAARDAYTGKMQMTDPETGMPTDAAIRRSIDMASLGGPGMPAATGEVVPGMGLRIFGKKLMSDTADTGRAVAATNQSFLPNGVPKPEAFDRVLPAVRNLETGKVSTTKRGDEHASILDKLWAKNGGDPNISTMDLYNQMLPKHEMGFYDPRNKEFWPRSHPDWQNIDSPDLTPKQAMKSGMVFSDTQKPGMAMAALHDAPTFYSAVEHAVNNGPKQALPSEWLGPRTERNYTDKNTGKEVTEVKYGGLIGNMKGVKPEELEWMGLPEWLQEKANRPGANRVEPVTKQEIQDFINQNKVELKEVNKGKFNPDVPLKAIKTDSGYWEIRNEQGQFLTNVIENVSEQQALEMARRRLERNNPTEIQQTATKYSKYQLPGGENYREKLLTLPNESGAQAQIQKQMRNARNTMPRTNQAERDAFNTHMEKLDNELERLMRAGEGYGQPEYKSSHWDEPNVLAHVRMNDRNMPVDRHFKVEGIPDKEFKTRQEAYAARDEAGLAGKSDVTEHNNKKSLHIEEIQSDWHQAGRDKGYKGQKEVPLATEGPFAGATGLEQGVPNAPFKKTWHELVLKRMIREAAEKGYDRISWTPGEAQAARYDLSKQVDVVHYNPKDGRLLAQKGNSNVLDETGIPEKELAKYIGKEAAEKLMKQKPDWTGSRALEGENLKIGGEGMKGFYDKMIPNAIEKIGKEHGVKVKTAEIKGNSTYEGKSPPPPGWKPKNQPVHYIDIPESLKSVAMKKGFPLFSGGFMFSPVAGNPHDNK